MWWKTFAGLEPSIEIRPQAKLFQLSHKSKTESTNITSQLGKNHT